MPMMPIKQSSSEFDLMLRNVHIPKQTPRRRKTTAGGEGPTDRYK
jgi:hypothetical protein